MKTETLPPEQRSGTEGGSFFPALCNFIGTLILLLVIAVSVPLSLPRYLGYEVFNVVSGSMAPEIPAEETMSENASERVPDTFLDPVRTTLWTPDSERSRHVVQEIVLPDEDEELPRSEKLSFVNAVLFLLVMASFLFCFFETGFLQYLLS